MSEPKPTKRPRDPRLDFFRGLAMFIILLAHTPGNTWTLWIPARFGFSDATEIFVFCSGMASALAFGAVFAKRGFLLGSARIGFRVWQVYWAHIGVLLVTALMLFAIDHYGLGARERPYIEGPWVRPLFDQTGEALIGLFTLTWVPGLFDILPMYLVILAMIPLVMLAHAAFGRPGVAVVVLGLWFAATLAGYARQYGDEEDFAQLAAWQQSLVGFGRPFLWMNFPSYPFGEGTWFFNPFGWQLVFFTGFAFGMGWLKAPPVDRRLIWLAAFIVIATVPLAWYKFHYNYSIVGGTFLHDWIVATRSFLEPLRWKTWQGLGRFVHFLALAYLAWVAVGAGGVRLAQGFSQPWVPSLTLQRVALAVLVLSLPIAYPEEIGWFISGYDEWLSEGLGLSFNQIGMLQLAHLVALLLMVWSLIGSEGRTWLARDALLKAVPVIRKVGTQSLAVFMVSIPLARFNGWLLDLAGRDVWSRAGINLFGFAVLIGVAYFAAWIKRQPWREPVAPRPNDRPEDRRPPSPAPASAPGTGPVPARA
ncbi:MAG: OpgC domain-containing protein [Pseudomonadota bacterium]